ncbi:MAG: ribosome recycling factor [bacterium]|nr:ribosome recycling factor [bacterium]
MLDDVYKETQAKMNKTTEATKGEMAAIRTGRASSAILDHVTVEYYGSQLPINQAATISVPEPRLILIQPWDKSVLPAIEKAILKSSLGLNPSNDGNVIRLPIPTLTEERRKELDKVVKRKAEDGRVSIRNIRRDTNELLKKMEQDKDISEDDLKHGKEKIQKLTDEAASQIDKILAAKEKELLEF